jgi:hypothetical protein
LYLEFNNCLQIGWFEAGVQHARSSYLTSFTQSGITRAWKGQDWDVLNRLHEKGPISDPKSKAKSVMLSDEAVKESARLFEKYFASNDETF